MHKILVSVVLIGILQIARPTPLVIDNPPPRHGTTIESYIEHEWWLLTWATNEFVCQLLTEEAETPSNREIEDDCSPEAYDLWTTYPFCEAASGGDPSSCRGLYLHYIGSQEKQREVIVELPLASVAVALEGCVLGGGSLSCPQFPTLTLTGIEPLADYQITQLHYERGGSAATCAGATCSLRLMATPPRGERIHFWADSSYGDSSPVFEALVRAIPAEDGTWLVDILSSQFADTPSLAFALEWEAFPPSQGLPDWLAAPASASDLATQEPYQYLAGRLIEYGAVDASPDRIEFRSTSNAEPTCGSAIHACWVPGRDSIVFDESIGERWYMNSRKWRPGPLGENPLLSMQVTFVHESVHSMADIFPWSVDQYSFSLSNPLAFGAYPEESLATAIGVFVVSGGDVPSAYQDQMAIARQILIDWSVIP